MLGKTIKSLQIGNYYMYCDLKYCFSCGEQKRILAQKQEMKAQIAAEKASKRNKEQDLAYKNYFGYSPGKGPK